MTGEAPEDGTTERSDFGVEMEARKAHIEALPGARFKEDLEALNRASYVLSYNGQELVGHVEKFVSSNLNAQNLADVYVNELVRFLHNYLTSVSSLIDAQRVIIRHIWPSEADPDRIDFEAAYTQNREAAFAGGEAAFVTKLRNYCTHYAIPVPGLGTQVSWSRGGPVVHVNTLQLERDKLLRWSNWGAAAKGYLQAQTAKFDLAPIIERYMASTRKFYKWFWMEVNERNNSAVEEVMQKGKELWLWYEDRSGMPEWLRKGQDHPPSGWSARRFRAENRIARFSHGTRGYVAHTITPDGTITLAADPWGPFLDR